MGTVIDPLGIRGREFTTAGQAMGRVEKRSQSAPSATTPLAAAAAREIDEALAAGGLAETDENLVEVGRQLGYTPRETELAIVAGIRLGLFSVE